MSEWLEIDPGVWVDENGEIVEGDTLSNTEIEWAANRYYHAKEQREGWEKTEKFLKSRLLLLCTDPRTVAGEWMVSRRQATRKVQDIESLHNWIEGAELRPGELRALAQAAKGYDPALLEDEGLKKQVEMLTRDVRNAPYVVVEPVKKGAPRGKTVVE